MHHGVTSSLGRKNCIGFKDSFVTPILKKSGLDEASPSSYRPISNLTVISKLLERLVSRQLVAYTLRPTICCQLLSQATGEATPPKLRPFVYFRIYSMQSIEETLLHSSCSTSRLRSTLWITKFCWSGCVLPSVSTIQPLHGFSLTSLDACSTFVVAANVLLLSTSSVVCHKDRSEPFHYLYC